MTVRAICDNDNTMHRKRNKKLDITLNFMVVLLNKIVRIECVFF